MTIGATEATSGTPPTVPTAGNGLGVTTSNSADKDMFLKLLVAQLKYQDPTNPADSSQFLSQSAQFTSLEKMQAIADQTGVLLGSSLAFGASGLVGKQVSYTLADGTEGSGTVSGVEFGADGPVLSVDGVQVPITSLVTVGTTVPSTPPSDPTA